MVIVGKGINLSVPAFEKDAPLVDVKRRFYLHDK